MMSLYAIGSKVKIGGGIAGVVTRISITSRTKVLYEVAWWDGRTRKSEWLEEFEVEALDPGDNMKIGFVN